MNNQELRIVVSAKDTASSVIKKIQRQLNDSSSSLSRGLDQANTSARNAGGGFDISAKKAALMGAVAGATATGITALARGLQNLGTSAIQGAADYEQSRIAFETMLGSADSARTMLKEIAQFAKTTPFELPEVVTGAKQLLAYQVSAEKIIPTFTMLGNIASAVGRERLPDLIRAFGQVQAKGKLMAQELNQFAEAGVPLRDMLAKELKMSMEDFSNALDKGQLDVKFAKVEQALNNLGGEGGKWGDLMAKQSKTFSGVVSNIKDGFGQMLRAAVGMTEAGDIVEGSFFDRIKTAADRTMPAIQAAAERVGPAMQRFMEHVDKLSVKFMEVATVVWKYLEPLFAHLWTTIEEDLMPSLRRLWHEVIEPLIPVLGAVLVGAIVVVTGVLIGLSEVISRVINVVLGWKRVMEETAQLVRNVIGGVVSFVTGQFMKVGEIIYRVVEWFKSLPENIKSALKGIGQVILGEFSGPLKWIITAVEKILNLFGLMKDKASESTADANARLGITSRLPGFASGGSPTPGQPAIVGERQAEVFMPNTRGRIMPSARDAQQGGMKVTNILSGTFTFQTAEAVDAFWKRVDKTQRLAKVGMA